MEILEDHGTNRPAAKKYKKATASKNKKKYIIQMASKHDDDEEGGELIMAGCAAWSMAGRSGPTRNYDGIPFEGNLLLGFHRVGSFVHSKTLITHVFTGPVASHTICLDTARQVCQSYIYIKLSHGYSFLRTHMFLNDLFFCCLYHEIYLYTCQILHIYQLSHGILFFLLFFDIVLNTADDRRTHGVVMRMGSSVWVIRLIVITRR